MKKKVVVFIGLLILAFVVTGVTLSPDDSLPPSGVTFALQHFLN